MNPIALALIKEYWKEVAGAIIMLALVITIAILLVTLHFKNIALDNADRACQERIDVIVGEYQENQKRLQDSLNQASADYEKAKSEIKVITENHTTEVIKYIDRPVYNNDCMDDDGLHATNRYIKAINSK
ncbi:hypothetical protein [Acinetobacter variabilis]|uniref:hypothetical protein n=1 Tax=Acinetobacter variabilis TaxID=70346 RepID=UPI003D7687F3